jgi:hypothetical protein
MVVGTTIVFYCTKIEIAPSTSVSTTEFACSSLTIVQESVKPIVPPEHVVSSTMTKNLIGAKPFVLP